MLFASQVRKTLTEVPGLEGQSVEIRKLGWKALDKAAEARTFSGIDMMRRIGPGGLLAELNAAGGEEKVRETASADPYLRYDRGVLVSRGIVSWSMSQSITQEQIDDLDEDTIEYIARQVYELSRPKTEGERKNA